MFRQQRNLLWHGDPLRLRFNWAFVIKCGVERKGVNYPRRASPPRTVRRRGIHHDSRIKAPFVRGCRCALGFLHPLTTILWTATGSVSRFGAELAHRHAVALLEEALRVADGVEPAGCDDLPERNVGELQKSLHFVETALEYRL